MIFSGLISIILVSLSIVKGVLISSLGILSIVSCLFSIWISSGFSLVNTSSILFLSSGIFSGIPLLSFLIKLSSIFSIFKSVLSP